jgi:hypothetical protein
MNVTLSRKYGDKETTSCLYVFSGDQMVFNCKTLELPNLSNQHNISCIPEGIYEVHKVTVPRLGNCFQVMNVPNRTGILIHMGNFATGKKIDTEGCILVGTSFMDINGDGYTDIAGTDVALKSLWAILPNTFNIHIFS